MKDCEVGGLELLRVTLGVAGRGGDELDALINDEVHNTRVAHKGLSDVHTEGLISEPAHGADLFTNLIKFTRGCFDDAHGAGVGYGRCQTGTSDPAHGCLNDGNLNTEHLGDAIGKLHVCPAANLPKRA